MNHDMLSPPLPAIVNTARRIPARLFRSTAAVAHAFEYGEISAKDRLSHTICQNRPYARQTIPDILTHDACLGSDMDFSGKTISIYYFAAKVKIGGIEKIVFVRTRKSAGPENRFYVHEVFSENEIKQSEGLLPNAPRMQTRGGSPSDFYLDILRNVLNVKR